MAPAPFRVLLSLTILLCASVSVYGDVDSDGIADSTDICPVLPNPEQMGYVKLNGPLVSGGEAQQFALSPDGAWAVYIADQDTDDLFELFSVPVEGGTPVKLNGPMIAAGDVFELAISPDSSRVVYRADQQLNSWYYAYSVPIAGGTAVLLSPGLRTFSGLLISPDSAWVAFNAPDTLFANPVYSTTSILGGTIYEHNTEQPNGEGNTHGGRFSPDSQWLMFLDSSGSPSANPRLYRTPPGESGLGSISANVVDPPYAFSPDSSRLVFAWGDYSSALAEPHSTPIHINDAVSLSNPADPWPLTSAFAISPIEIDGGYRVILGDDYGLLSAAIDGTERISLDSTYVPNKIAISPDGSRVVYGRWQLFSVDILGETDPVELSGTMVPSGRLEDFAISPDGQYVVYRADQDTDGIIEIFAVPITGGDEVKMNSTLIPDGDVDDDYLISPDGQSVVFRADHAVDDIYELFAASVHGGEVLRLNDPLPPGGSIESFALTSDGARAVYLGDQDSDGNNELFSVMLYTDADADGVYGSCDCAPTDDQSWTVPQEVSGLLLTHSGGPLGTTTLTWNAIDYHGAASDAVYDTLRSNLKDGFHSGAGGTIDCVETDDGSDTESLDSTPVGNAFFYLIRAGNACGEGSAGKGRDAGVQTSCPQ